MIPQFVCPCCKHLRLEEILVNVNVASVIGEVFRDGYAEYEEQTNSGGVIDRFQCVNCGYVITDNGNRIDDYDDLIDWLKKEKTNDSEVS